MGRKSPAKAVVALVLVALGAVALAAAVGGAGAASSRPVIAFDSERGGPMRIHVLGITPGAQRTLQSASHGHGRRAGVVADRAQARDRHLGREWPELRHRHRQRERHRPVSASPSGPSWDEEPTWSPDGKWIAFGSDRTGNFDVWIVHPDGTGWRLITAKYVRGHRAVLVARRVEDRLHEPPRRLPAPLGDERRRVERASPGQDGPLGALPGRRTARRSPSSSDAGGNDDVYTVSAEGRRPDAGDRRRQR